MRVVCLTEETTEVLYALGASELIVGISGFTVRPPEARREKPKVSTFLDAKFDEILALQPDVVFTWSDLQADIAAELVRRGVEVVCFNQRSVTGILEMVRRLGGYLGLRAQADEYADKLEAGIEAAAARGTQRPVRPRVYFEEWYDPLITGICWVSELIEICGGDDVFVEHRAFPGAKERILADPLEPLRRDPDLLIASWCGKMFKPEVVRQRPGWEAFRPNLTNELHEIESSVILQPGPAALTDGVQALMRIFDRWEQRQR
jgi:iron complex transport system substrate-binding protein